MSGTPIPVLRWLIVPIWSLAGLLALLTVLAVDSHARAAPGSPAGHPNLHSVVSQSKLTPPLRSTVVGLRYSPNGSYLLLQDPAGVVVLLRNPLRILFHISTSNIYPAAFATDSQSLVLVSRALSYARWRLPDGEKIASGDLPGQDDCADGRLSSGGEFFACLKPDLDFLLFDITTGKSVYGQSMAPPLPAGPGGLRSFYPVDVLHFSLLDIDSAFSGPFGLIRTDEPRPNPGRPLYDSSIHFSPDTRTLLARLPKGGFGLDIVAKKTFEPPGPVQRGIAGEVTLESSERVIAVENVKGPSSEGTATILSLRNGAVLANLSLSATRLQMASNPRFLLEYSSSPDGQSAAAFDLEQSRSLETPPATALDVRSDEVAVYTQNGSLALYRIGERNLVSSLPVPLPSLPWLRSAAVTPSLDKLALSVDGAGAIFDVSSGQRIATVAKFSAVNFPGQQEACLLFPKFREDPGYTSRVDLATGAVFPSWEVGREEWLRSGGPVLFHYSPLKGMKMILGDIPELGMEPSYALRALDPGTGKELWKREFAKDAPTPFADPQGEHLILGWRAKSSEARSAASHHPLAREILNKSKPTDHDSFFEVLDARSGNSVAGVLVMAGHGAASFDAAFSAGDTLILQKDGSRVSLYSLLDGQLKSRLVGFHPSATAEGKLLALDMGEGRLGIFDLSSGIKLDEQLFPEALAYAHFSADGKRLLILTEHQTAAILDVSHLRGAPLPASQTPNGKE